jgi:hypothetical protein
MCCFSEEPYYIHQSTQNKEFHSRYTTWSQSLTVFLFAYFIPHCTKIMPFVGVPVYLMF